MDCGQSGWEPLGAPPFLTVRQPPAREKFAEAVDHLFLLLSSIPSAERLGQMVQAASDGPHLSAVLRAAARGLGADSASLVPLLRLWRGYLRDRCPISTAPPQQQLMNELRTHFSRLLQDVDWQQLGLAVSLRLTAPWPCLWRPLAVPPPQA